jgi:hypothetical protein
LKKFAKFIVLATVCFLFLGFGCKKQTTTTTDQTSSTTQTSTDAQGILSFTSSEVENTTTSNLNSARKKLVYWDKNANLFNFSVDFSGLLNKSSITTTYVFNSTLAAAFNKYYYFAISFNNLGTSIRTLVYKDDYAKNIPKPVKKIDTKYWTTNWFDAFKKAEEKGGKTFREKDSTNTKINLSLYKGNPSNYLYWFITYSKTNAEDVFTAQINANSGEVVTSSGTENTGTSTDSSTSTDTNSSSSSNSSTSTPSDSTSSSSDTTSQTTTGQ